MKFTQARTKAALILAVTILYAITFKSITDKYGTITAPMVAIPVVLAGWFFGGQAGLFASLISILLNAFLFTISLPMGWDLWVHTTWAGNFMVILVGIVAGRLHDFVDKRTRAEAALRASEILYRTIVEDQTDLVCRMTPDGRMTFVNQSYLRFYNKTLEEVIGTSIEERDINGQSETIKTSMAILGSENPIISFEEYLLQADGDKRWTQWIERAIIEDGKVIEIQAVGRDITERKWAEDKLIRSERKLSEAQNIAQMGSWEWDILANKTEWSSELYNIFGISSEFLVSNTYEGLLNYVHPLDRERVAHVMEQTLATKKSFSVEYRIVRPDGVERYIHTRGQVITDREGQAVRMHSSSQDITERKRAEEEIIKLSNAVEQSADIIYITNLDSKIEYVNPAFEAITGYSKEEALGKTPRILSSGIMSDDYYKRMWTTILSGEVFRSEIINRKKNGEFFYYDQTITPIKNTYGNTTHFVSTGKDITERKQAENEIRRHERYLTLLKMAMSDILDPKNPGDRYYDLITHFVNLFVADYGYLFRWDATQKWATLIASTLPLNQPLPDIVLKPGESGMIESVLQTEHALVIDNVLDSQDIFNTTLFKNLALPIHSIFGIPLIAREHKLGIVILAYNKPRHFTAEEINQAEQGRQQIALALWSVQQEAEIQKRLLESDALAKIARTLSETERFGLQTVLQLIVTSAKELIPGAQQAVIHLLDEEEQTLSSEAVVGFDYPAKGKMKIPVNEGVAGQVITSGEIINITDIEKDERFISYGASSKFRSLMVGLVKSGNKKLGTISVQSSLVGAFSEDESRLLSALGTQAAIAIENANLLERTKQSLKETNALYRINRGLAALKVEELLDDVVELLKINFDYYHVQVYLVDSETGDFILRSASGEIGKKLINKKHSMHAGEGIIGHVAETFEPFFTNDVDEVIFFIRNPLLPETKSELTVPVKNGGQLLGILDVQQAPPRILTARDVQLMITVADQLAVALQKAELYEDLQISLEQEKETRHHLLQNERLAIMGRLLASVSHELNNPLQAIQNALFLLKNEKGISKQGLQDLDIVLAESERMAGLIDRLRTTYRPTQADDFKPTQINQLIEDVHALLTTHLKKNQVVFEFRPDPGLPPIPVISDQIRQVLINLFMNAVEAMSAGDTLTAETNFLEGTKEALISVSDNGTGISEAILPGIFEPFITDKPSGTGLGLTISRDIVIKHNGRITAENNPHGGATFKVWLPIKIKENE